jgi:hypothetical protein
VLTFQKQVIHQKPDACFLQIHLEFVFNPPTDDFCVAYFTCRNGRTGRWYKYSAFVHALLTCAFLVFLSLMGFLGRLVDELVEKMPEAEWPFAFRFGVYM